MANFTKINFLNYKVPIMCENIGDKKFPIFYFRAGFLFNKRSIISGGIYWSKKIALLKLKSELWDRYNIYNFKTNNNGQVQIVNFFTGKIINIPLWKISPIIKNSGVDGSGFATHKIQKVATDNSIRELIERKLIRSTDNSKVKIYEVISFENYIHKNIQIFFINKKLSLKVFALNSAINNGPTVFVVKLVTKDQKNIFGSACSENSAESLNKACLETIMLYYNINNIWKNQVGELTGKSKQIFENYHTKRFGMFYEKQVIKKISFKPYENSFSNIFLKKIFREKLFFYKFETDPTVHSFKFHADATTKINTGPFC